MRDIVLAFLVAAAGCAAAPAGGAGEIRAGLMGDVPYSHAGANLLEDLIDQMNAEPLAFVAHVGDITSGTGPCSDDWLSARKRQFARIRASFVLLPGDNEWTDCHRSGFDPMERLARWRELFCTDDGRLRIERQSVRQPEYGEYCEHVRWETGRLLFVGLNVPGSNNNLGRTAEMDAEHRRRSGAVLAWLAAGMEEAARRGLAGVVVLMQADPDFAEAHTRRRGGDGYAALREALRAHAARLAVPLTVVHGDSHVFIDDRPAKNLRRIEVEGWPLIGWLHTRIGPDGSLSVEKRVPRLRGD